MKQTVIVITNAIRISFRRFCYTWSLSAQLECIDEYLSENLRDAEIIRSWLDSLVPQELVIHYPQASILLPSMLILSSATNAVDASIAKFTRAGFTVSEVIPNARTESDSSDLSRLKIIGDSKFTSFCDLWSAIPCAFGMQYKLSTDKRIEYEPDTDFYEIDTTVFDLYLFSPDEDASTNNNDPSFDNPNA